uniref:Uncharacterized protein n=1 Tax=Rhizophora mucronata TaxID=61149 RepID=A0A2P2R1W4_RHIMU
MIRANHSLHMVHIERDK